MPIRYRLDPSRRLVRTVAWGELTNQDLLEHQAGLRQDRDFDPKFDQLVDLTRVSRIEVTSEGILELAEATVFDRGVRRVMVAPADALFGMARMFQALRDAAGEQHHVVRTLAEARELLGIEADQWEAWSSEDDLEGS